MQSEGASSMGQRMPSCLSKMTFLRGPVGLSGCPQQMEILGCLGFQMALNCSSSATLEKWGKTKLI